MGRPRRQNERVSAHHFKEFRDLDVAEPSNTAAYTQFLRADFFFGRQRHIRTTFFILIGVPRSGMIRKHTFARQLILNHASKLGCRLAERCDKTIATLSQILLS